LLPGGAKFRIIIFLYLVLRMNSRKCLVHFIIIFIFVPIKLKLLRSLNWYVSVAYHCRERKKVF